MKSKSDRAMNENNIVKTYNKKAFINPLKHLSKMKILVISLIAGVTVSTSAVAITFIVTSKKNKKENLDKNNKLIECEIGFFIPEDSGEEKTCEKCQLDNCAKCSGTKLENECNLCIDYYKPIISDGVINQCILDCETGINEKCLTCNTTNAQCSSCNIGYFIPEDDETKKQCQKCSSDYCITCTGSKLNNICLECYNISYEVIDGNCQKKVYSIEAKCKTTSNNQTVKLINQYTDIIIKEIMVDNKIIYTPNYTFPKAGEYMVYFILDISKTKTLDSMFANNGYLKSISFLNFDTTNIINMKKMFSNSNLNFIDVSKFNTKNVVSMSSMFAGCKHLGYLNLTNFDTQKVTDMGGMFYNCDFLFYVHVKKFDTRNVVNMHLMFYQCSYLRYLDLSSFITSKITNMNYMFYKCRSLTSLDISNFDTQKVTNMEYMFYECQSLVSLDVSKFNTKNVKSFFGMFFRCQSLTSLDVSHFNTENAVSMGAMFEKCQSLTSLDVSNFYTPKLEEIFNMFKDCYFLKSLDLSHFNTQKITDMSELFTECRGLEYLDISSFNTENVI